MAFAGLSLQLGNRARQKDFEHRVLRYAGALLQAGMRFTHNLSVAEDLVQQTMLRAWYEFDHLEADADCRVWLFKTMLSLRNCADHVAASTSFAVPLENGKAGVSSSLQPNRNEDVANALDHLCDDMRIVLLLFSVEGFSCAEISEILTIPLDTVISKLAAARGLVKRNLGARPVLKAAP